MKVKSQVVCSPNFEGERKMGKEKLLDMLFLMGLIK